MALDKAGIQDPYVLCPHSLSGLEALYWAQKYPDEVEAIVGLDIMGLLWESQGGYQALQKAMLSNMERCLKKKKRFTEQYSIKEQRLKP